MTKLLCVYCASSDRLDPKYYAAAAELGRQMVSEGWGLVYGGGRTGMMGAVARAVTQTKAWKAYLDRNGQRDGFLPGSRFSDFLEAEWAWYRRHLGQAGLLPAANG